ncbi:MAG: hypothetical protein RSE41_01140 [Clostridia bacterium]
MKEYKTESNSISITLFIVFLILKLTGVIDWSWWYITMPLWLPFIIMIVIAIICYIFIKKSN